MKKKTKNLKEKGITLVALVVTIVIMLILAGVTLNIALSDNGLFAKAKQAVEKYKNEQEKEQYILNNLNIGKSNKHYIYNKKDLEEFRDNVNNGYSYKDEEVILMDNIDLGGKKEDQSTWWNPIGSFENNKYFEGIFDGNNYSIEGLYNETYQSDTFVLISLFSFLNDAEIKNLTVDGEITIGQNDTEHGGSFGASGIVGGTSGNCKISNCKNSVDVTKLGTGDSVGGIISGFSGTLIIEDCVNEGNISGSNNCGGIVGLVGGDEEGLNTLIINNSYNIGNITNTYGNYVGGLIGRDGGGDIKITITNSYNLGTITGINRIGGLAGRLGYGTSLELLVNNCYNKGNILTTQETGTLGGLISQIINTANPCNVKICNSWNERDILLNEADSVMIGGLLSESLGGKNVEIINCYNKGNLTCGTSGTAGGLIGRIRDTDNSNPNLNITNSYNSGKVTGGTILTGILRIQHTTAKVNLVNTYYSKASATSGTVGYEPLQKPTEKEDSYMKTKDFVDELNNNINSINSDVKLKKWIYDEGSYPILEK